VSILGHRVARREDPALLTTGGTYVDDVTRDGVAHVVYLRSNLAHGMIRSIDCTEALAAAGVLTVVSAADLDLPPIMPTAMVEQRMIRPILASDRVRFVGEPIVAVVAETREAALDAAETVIIDIEPLEALIDPRHATDTDAPLLHPEVGTNIALAFAQRGEPISFEDCDIVVTRTILNQRVAAAPLEPRSALCWWEDDRLVLEIGCQGPHPIRTALAEAYGLDPARVRVICPDVGGGFGAKAQLPAEALLLGELARRINRPVRWSETRSENLVGMNHGRGQIQTVTLGGTRDGQFLAYRLHVTQEAGAYPNMGAMLPLATRIMASGVYEIGRVQFDSVSVVTNTTPTGAYRGAGRPEASAAIERIVDVFAAEAGLDPAEVRRRNLIPADAFPYTTPTRTTYDSGDYAGALDRALAAAGYADLRAEQAERRQRGETRVLGIGISCYVEITAMPGGDEYGSVELLADGSVRVITGSTPYGQGHQTSWAMLVSERTGIPMDRITVEYGDTDVVPRGEVTGGSRSLQIAGAAVFDASARLVDLARERAADLLEAAIDDVVLDSEAARFHVSGSPAVSIGWEKIAATIDTATPMFALSEFVASGPTFPFGAHVAVVEVDTETGHVELQRLIACDDAGTILNPLIVDGQVHGGLAQGAAQALFEEVRFDEDGNPLTATFIDYTIPSAAEFPMFERVEMETPTPINPLGAKGIGESGTIGSTPAVHNAVIDALRHLGIDHIDMPLTPLKVWAALRAAG
jgi:carbon-monoxide dehydrogenase large subunit